MTKFRRKIAGVILALGMGASIAACATVSEPNQVGLYYNMGTSDGYEFDSCIDPGKTGDAEWNNEVIYLPTKLLDWKILENGGNTDKPTVVAAKPVADQPSGVRVKVWSQTSFYLNTYCDGTGGMARAFWEKIGRGYGANSETGLQNMILAKLVPPLQKAQQDIIRDYDADELIGNVGGVRAEAQKRISEAFTAELKRLTGGDYFCGPSFDRLKNECPAVEVIIVDVDLNNEALQAARDKKIAAQEEAAALVAAAEGQVKAAQKLNALYQNEAWMALEMAKLHLQEVQACSSNPNCTIFFDSNGKMLIANNKK